MTLAADPGTLYDPDVWGALIGGSLTAGLVLGAVVVLVNSWLP